MGTAPSIAVGLSLVTLSVYLVAYQQNLREALRNKQKELVRAESMIRELGDAVMQKMAVEGTVLPQIHLRQLRSPTIVSLHDAIAASSGDSLTICVSLSPNGCETCRIEALERVATFVREKKEMSGMVIVLAGRMHPSQLERYIKISDIRATVFVGQDSTLHRYLGEPPQGVAFLAVHKKSGIITKCFFVNSDQLDSYREKWFLGRAL